MDSSLSGSGNVMMNNKSMQAPGEIQASGTDTIAMYAIQRSTEEGMNDPSPDTIREQVQTFRHVRDNVPSVFWLVIFIGATQRFALLEYSTISSVYLMFAPDDPLTPGALGWGEAKTERFLMGFYIANTFTDLVFAYMADTWLGRYKALLLGHVLLLIGSVVMLCTSILGMQHAISKIGFLVALFAAYLGAAARTVATYPFLADQFLEKKPQVASIRRGEVVIVDRAMTVQYCFNALYLVVNVVALACYCVSLMMEHIGTWTGFLLQTCLLAISTISMILCNSKLVKQPPHRNAWPHAFHICLIAVRSRFSLAAALPSYQREHHQRSVPWSPEFIIETKHTLGALQVLLCSTIFYFCFTQTINNAFAQADQMKYSDGPRDLFVGLFTVMNPIICIVLVVIFQTGLYPGLAYRRVRFGPVARMSTAFIIMAFAMGYAAVLQSVIYRRGPCFDHPLKCSAAMIHDIPAKSGQISLDPEPNDVSIWLQIPLHVMLGVGEVLGNVAIAEFASKAFANGMKSLPHGLISTLGSLIVVSMRFVDKDPWLVVTKSTIAGVSAFSGCLFWTMFRQYDEEQTSSDALG